MPCPFTGQTLFRYRYTLPCGHVATGDGTETLMEYLLRKRRGRHTVSVVCDICDKTQRNAGVYNTPWMTPSKVEIEIEGVGGFVTRLEL